MSMRIAGTAVYLANIAYINQTVNEFLNGATTIIGVVFSRRRSTEEGMRRLSRYLATVRRAMTMSATFSRATITSSESTSCGSSASIICSVEPAVRNTAVACISNAAPHPLSGHTNHSVLGE